MKSHLFFFLTAFAVGCVAALAARSAWYQPHANHAGHPATPAYAPMVNNTAAPAAVPHAGHEAASSAKPVNTLCTLCGMEVDPTIQPATYKGKLIGFGCRMCPPKFAADPERYGPSALENKVLSE